MAPQHHAEFQKKTNGPIPRKLPDGRTEGRKDEQTLIQMTLPATAGGP